MSLYYRLGWPFGLLVASLGIPTVIRIDVIRDDEAGVFVGTSNDVRGLVVEADTLEGVLHEARLVIPDLVSKPGIDDNTVACVRYGDRVVHA